jgi:hypothetical protein
MHKNAPSYNQYIQDMIDQELGYDAMYTPYSQRAGYEAPWPRSNSDRAFLEDFLDDEPKATLAPAKPAPKAPVNDPDLKDVL